MSKDDNKDSICRSISSLVIPPFVLSDVSTTRRCDGPPPRRRDNDVVNDLVNDDDREDDVEEEREDRRRLSDDGRHSKNFLFLLTIPMMLLSVVSINITY